jgi:lipoprotein-anchoring transpeptidase ErfK/SrfK
MSADPKSNLSRRRLLTHAVGAGLVVGLGGPALAQSYGLDAEPDVGTPSYGRVPDPRDRTDPFWTDPYGRRRVPPADGEPMTGVARVRGDIDYARAYAAATDEPFPVPAFNWRKANPVFLRQAVAYDGGEAPGTVIIDPRAHHLTLVYGGGTAMRYGVGVGRQGFAWAGTATINSKQAWPDWYPPKEMLERQHGLAQQMSKLQSGIGMAGGPHNPLGARAMYLWQGNKDTLYRIHGTTEPQSIGRSVSSGCIRMINQDAIDLYGRVPIGAKVIVVG